MAHNRKLVIGTVALVMGRLRKDGPAIDEVRDEIEQLMLSCGFLAEAPFKFISLIIRYGLVNKTKPEYKPISKKYRDLPIAIELNMDMLKTAEKNGSLKPIFLLATLEALIDVGNKHNLPVEWLIEKKEEVIKSTGINIH